MPDVKDSSSIHGVIPAKCPNCGKGPFVRDEGSGELVCSNCGYVLLEREEEGGQTFSPDQGGTAGAIEPPTLIARPDEGISTTIGRSDTDAEGRGVSGGATSAAERLRVLDRRSQQRGKGMGKAFDKMRTIAGKLSLGEGVVAQAAYIYRKARDKEITRGRSTAGLAAACLYAACREEKIPRSLKDVAVAGNVKMKELTRSYRFLVKSLDITMPVENPIRSLAKVGSALEASPRVVKRARELLERASALGLSAGKDPMAQAGAALYLACRLEGEKPKSQKAVAEAAEVSEVTLRNGYHSLRAGLNLEERRSQVS